MNVTCRLLTARDGPALRALLRPFFEQAGNDWPGDDAFDAFFARQCDEALDAGRDAPGPLRFLGAFERAGDGEEGGLLGVISLALVPSTYQFRPFVYCDDLYVTPDARGRAVGRALIDAAEQLGRSWGASTLMLGVGMDDADARAFYERVGLRPMGNELFYLSL